VKFFSSLISFFSRLFKRGSQNDQRGDGHNGNVSDDNYPMF